MYPPSKGDVIVADQTTSLDEFVRTAPIGELMEFCKRFPDVTRQLQFKQFFNPKSRSYGKETEFRAYMLRFILVKHSIANQMRDVLLGRK